MTGLLKGMWHDQRGSQGLEAAAAALVAALIVTALLGGANVAGPAVERAFGCAAAVLAGGGGACAGAGGVTDGGAAPASKDKPWWERAWDWTKDRAGKFLEGAWDKLKGAWNWLWEEHEWAWWKDALNWLKDHGPLGMIAAGILGFAMDLLFGIGMDGKFRWGMVIFATATSILSIFGVGLLAKIPVIGKLFMGGGALAKLGAWFTKLPWVAKLGETTFGKWLAKLGVEGFSDLLQGKFGTWLTNLGHAIQKIPVVGPVLGKLLQYNKALKAAGNYLWRWLSTGPVGVVGDVIKTIIKDVLAPKPGTPMDWVVGRAKRLFVWKAVRDIIKWIIKPTLPPFPFP